MEENNKIIAEFMGLNNLKDSKGDAWDYMNTGKSIYTLRTKNLHYESDWNWLMKVVEKIYQTDLYYDKYIDFNSSMFSNGKIELSTNIKEVYNQCVEFINFYNKQKEE